jgi:hypothetical protein
VEVIGTHQLLVYAGDVKLLDENINTIKEKEALLVACKDVGLEVNAEKTKPRLMSRHLTTGQNHCIRVVNKPL